MLNTHTKSTTRSHILRSVRKLFSRGGFVNSSIRSIAKKIDIAPSVIYYYFPNKEALLRSMFDETNTRLGKKRSQLPQLKSFVKLLEQRILFQFDQSESVSAVLKYYFYSRDTFPRQKDGGYLPEKSALHIEEILRIAHESGELRPDINIPESAKVITHAINGFVMEYYPRTPKGRERKQLAKTISALFYPALTGRNYPHDTKRKGGDYIL